MNVVPDLRTPSAPIDLGATPEFQLGGVRICPDRRQVRTVDGECRELEPRVMQVLVALATEKGRVVSRQHLIDRCWNGRIVGDDAINRCIVALRRLSKEVQPQPFVIETVARVGYSLAECLQEGPAELANSAPEHAWQSRKPLRRLLVVAALASILGAGVAFWPVSQPRPIASVSARTEAEQLYGTATRLYFQRTPAADAEAERLLRHAVQLDPSHAPSWARLALVMRTPIWHAEREGPAAAAARREEAIGYARRALALDRKLGEAHVAMGQLLWQFEAKIPWYERAVALSPDSAEAWNGLGSALSRTFQLRRALNAFQRALQLEPSFFPAVQNAAGMLQRLGRRDEARALVARAFDVGLSSARTRNTFAVLAVSEGQLAEAAKHSAAALADDPRQRHWPRLMVLRIARQLGDKDTERRILRLDPTLAASLDLQWSPSRALELARRSPASWWDVEGQGARARHLLAEGQSSLLVDLYRARFNGPDALWRDCPCSSGEVVPPLVVALRAAGQEIDAVRLRDRWAVDIAKQRGEGDQSATLAIQIAALASLRGDSDLAAAALENAVAKGWRGQFPNLAFSPALDPVFAAVRDRPRFQAAIRVYDAAVEQEARALRRARISEAPVL